MRNKKRIQRVKKASTGPGPDNGAALIIALCFLVIITGVILALYTSTRNDLVSSRVFAGGQATTLLADTAVNIVEGQITAATTGTLVAWASQPGMIHTYANSGSGTHTAYKLYSSGTMVDPSWGATDMANETSNMEGWKATTDTTTSYNAVWCDLNAPAVVNRTSLTNTLTSTLTPVFPIVDPGAAMTSTYTTTVPNVQGFGFSNVVPGTNAGSSATDSSRRLAMPVQWIYVLKNGQMIAPLGTTYGSTATFNSTGSLAPSQSNPIVGRIAFWADDDTCKLNINTASEGTFWDIPRASLPQESFLGFTLPILDEFQALGGHPATTCLDPVLGDLLPRPSFNFTSSTSTINSTTGSLNVAGSGSYTGFEPYYAMNPRVSDNAVLYNPYAALSSLGTTVTGTTSQGGTVSTVIPNNSGSFLPTVVFKSDRLYATPDEFLFAPNRNLNPNYGTEIPAGTATLTAATLAQRDFFITAQSRAPETTLFGTPRICLWPIQQVNSTGTCQSARDKLIAYCATTGTGSSAPIYYFQRGEVSLFGGTASTAGTYQTTTAPASTSATTDWNITRNQNLFTYATSMMEAPTPGFCTGTFSLASKWGNVGCERVMTMALDMIRSGLSQVGTTAPTSSSPAVSWSYRNEIPSPGYGIRGSVVPLQVTTNGRTYNGIGRNWRVVSAAIQVVPTARIPKIAASGTITAQDGWQSTDPEPGTTGIQAILLLNLYNPMPTAQIVESSFRVAVSSNTGLGIQVVGIGSSTISTGTVFLMNGMGGNSIFYRNYPFPGFAGLLYPASPPASWPYQTTSGLTYRTLVPGGTGNEGSDEINNYPFETGTVTIGYTGTIANASTFNITGGSITISILQGYPQAYNAPPSVVQTETLNFPSWSNLPMPQYVTVSSTQAPTNYAFPSSTGTVLPGLSSRAPLSTSTTGSYNSGGSWFMPGDIVGEVQLNPNGPTKGDYRLLAVANNIPSSWFAANPNYGGTVTTFSTSTLTTPPSTLAAIQAEATSMLNRFAFSFPDPNGNNGNPATYGLGDGYDSSLGTNPRWAAAGSVGISNNGTGAYSNNSYYYGQNYTTNLGGLVLASGLKLFADASINSNYRPAPGSGVNTTPPNSPPVIPYVGPTGTNTGTTTTTGSWVPANAAGAGDWTADYASAGDGAVFSAPDSASWETSGATECSFYTQSFDWPSISGMEAITEPNRVVASPIGLFGSLPTPNANSMISGDGYGSDLQPWQSMLFCPNPAAGSTHPGFGQNTAGTGAGPTTPPPFSAGAPDHVFADLFWMPVVEPYAISDALSTAGKVNLNYQMEPFTHITRRTALVGVLTPVEIGAISNSASYYYKQPQTSETAGQFLNTVFTSTFTNTQTRFTLNLDTSTVPGGTPPSLTSGAAATGCFSDFETRFKSGDVFRSASEVSMIDLVPTGYSAGTSLSNWWSNYKLTGLNMRESPYNQIYSRVTTKSNTYTVHYWVQSLQQVSTLNRNWAVWNENQDVKTGEYRGNTTIERYLDPNTPNLPDYATIPTASYTTGNYTPISQYYSWRVVLQKQFAPGSN